MENQSRRLFYIGIGAFLATNLLAMISAICPRWIEFLHAGRPDEQDGSIERMIMAGMVAVTIVLFTRAAIGVRSGSIEDKIDQRLGPVRH